MPEHTAFKPQATLPMKPTAQQANEALPPRWLQVLAAVLAVAASLAVFALYMQPEFLLSLADKLWSCF